MGMHNSSPGSHPKQLLEVGSILRAAPALLWRTDAALSTSLFALQVCQTLVPLAQLWVAKLIIDRLVSARRLPHPLDNSHPVLWLVALEFGLAVLGLLLREGSNYQRQVLAERVTGYVSLTILTHAQRLDLPVLEQPEFYDRVRRAEESAFYRPAALLFQLLSLIQAVVTLLAAVLILAHLQPLALPLLVLAALPFALVQSGTAARFYTLSMGQTPETRQARYLSHLLSTDDAAKEIRVFGLGRYLIGRYRSILQRNQNQVARLAFRRSVWSAVTAVLPAAVYAAIFAYLCIQALNRSVSIGDLTLFIGIILRSQDSLQQLMVNLSSVLEHSLFIQDYQSFLRIQPIIPTGTGSARVPLPLRDGVRFEGVTYTYPGSSEPALNNVSLEMRAGETVAIVGENGAGKTTLVKILARLYVPDSGRVTVDGHDLNVLDAEEWRRNIGVIFQDFIQYYLTAAENIGFGDIDALDDLTRIKNAAKRGGADNIIAQFAEGFDAVLGRWFDRGTQLSGGEWQRIALARAYMRDAPILVLDEPTASLDARAEYEMFQDFRERTRDQIVLLISHRFSTVRMADRIYVLDGGHIAECGNHEELMARDGRYAELFHLQAAGYL
jgi:ATP-binding cassette, subfamily B, bacterial